MENQRLASSNQSRRQAHGAPAEESRRPRILRIIARLNTGGPARHVTLLSRGLEKKGYPHLLVAGRVGRGEGSLQPSAKTAGIDLYDLPWMGSEINPGKDFISLLRLITVIRRFQPDIVHTHTAKAGFLGRWAAYLCGVPRIFHTYHGHVLHGYFSRPKQDFYRLLERLAGKISTRLITLTEGLASEMVELGVAGREKFEIIPLGLELSPFLEVQPHAQLKAQLRLDATATLVGCVGRLVAVKNLEALLKAMPALGGTIHLVLVGDGEDRKSLEEKSRSWGLSDRVHFYGWCENLPWMYGGLDLVINCSRNEGTPVSLLEALAAGVPVVAAPVGGVPELLRQVGEGTLLEGIRGEEIVRGIQGVLGDLQARRPTAEKRRTIVETFSVEALVKRIEELYQTTAPGPVPTQ
jgi:glycosyltransferase involved in cell wall biosynthesis